MKILKIIGILVLLTFITVSAFTLYYGRSQTIDFSSMLGNEVTVCNQVVKNNNEKYIKLKAWLHKNQTSWKSTPASILQDYVYSSKDLSINVSKGWVVINYGKSDTRSQVTITADTKDIIGKCVLKIQT